jgi:hypothetical protein
MMVVMMVVVLLYLWYVAMDREELKQNNLMMQVQVQDHAV